MSKICLRLFRNSISKTEFVHLRVVPLTTYLGHTSLQNKFKFMLYVYVKNIGWNIEYRYQYRPLVKCLASLLDLHQCCLQMDLVRYSNDLKHTICDISVLQVHIMLGYQQKWKFHFSLFQNGMPVMSLSLSLRIMMAVSMYVVCRTWLLTWPTSWWTTQLHRKHYYWMMSR